MINPSRTRSWIQGTVHTDWLDRVAERWPVLGRISERVGRKGAFLLLMGFMYLDIGYSYVVQPVTAITASQLKLALRVAPLWVYGLGWMFGGALMMIVGSSLTHRFTRDTWGFVVGAMVPAVWSTVWFSAWADGDASVRGWILYFAFASAMFLAAGFANPPRPSDIRTLEALALLRKADH